MVFVVEPLQKLARRFKRAPRPLDGPDVDRQRARRRFDADGNVSRQRAQQSHEVEASFAGKLPLRPRLMDQRVGGRRPLSGRIAKLNVTQPLDGHGCDLGKRRPGTVEVKRVDQDADVGTAAGGDQSMRLRQRAYVGPGIELEIRVETEIQSVIAELA